MKSSVGKFGTDKRSKFLTLFMSTALSAAVLTGGAAVAQTAGDEAQAEPTDLIVVTGSRLVRRDLVAPSPVTTVDQAQIEKSGSVTLEQTLNEFPQLNPDNTSTTNQSGGTGVLSADLRGLGAVRTLVLVDGRRFIPADETGLVDLATVPDLLIDRVEIITGGASAVYGSDAISGAVNFILKDDFEGAEARYQYGETGEGDGQTHKLDFLLGVNAPDGRGNIVAHAAYTKRDPVFMGDREFSSQPFLADANGEFQPFGSGNIPGGLISVPSSDFDQINGLDLNAAAADCQGSSIQGIRFGAGSEPLPFCRITDQYNYAADNFLLRPFERYQATTSGFYKITDNIEAYGQMFYTNKENSYQQAPEAVTPTSSGQESGTIAIPNADTNPLYPQVLRDFFAANRSYFDADGDGTFLVRNTGRRFEEFGPRNSNIVAESFNLTGGLRGDFDFMDNPWRWDAFYQYQQSDVIVNQTGRLSVSRTTLGLDTIVVDGQVQCRNQILGCVPVNLFGTDALTPEMADFLSVGTGREDKFTRQVAGASVSGELFELPAGPVATAFGAEWRKETFDTRPDQIALAGDLTDQGGVAPTINGGELDVAEIFAEVRVPLLQGLPAVESLAVEAAARYSDYSTVGGVFTWKAGVDWEITDWVRARGSYNRAIRAPNLNELFEAPGRGFTGGVDPCVAANNPTDAQKQLCLQQGVPADVIDTLEVGASQGFDVFSGGNPNLSEEKSDTYTAGFVLLPPMVPGLSITADYFDITVEDAIAQVSAQVLVDTCFDTLDANSAACQSITRFSGGNINSVNAPLLNVASRAVSGIDLGVGYSMDLPDMFALPNEGAGLDLRFVSTWQFDDTTVPLEGLPEVECAGFFGGPCSSNGTRITPDYRGLVTANWSSGPVSLRGELQIIGDVDLSDQAFQLQKDKIDRHYYVDLTGDYQVTDNVQLFAGVNNVFDKQPPVIGFRAGGDSNTQMQLYDVLGRRFFVGAKLSF